ncbi:MATE family efflux transporter [Ponticoccus sp. SC2-23]|uniref:MATE family efflux transporter n=1 Tax=Alexandriicola marinus TaxID=2081710 RepID=UPI000FD9D317|nr:MATE family efflux transporter [Alexandriicola marinus]MBM1219969.1 MATE family efflux transporter [Ponticoccus sp. SC6-9]MBM1224655.1 MATE family efflux transporter [Ponticoccus sp. SC6-15]MBM1228168.1 MATE family efflux transporter [Ponticoccus sp. SC6-38]MBM1234194.1 MATE family efflux transporter [Ponticoccus sp. SC6-45]MBM1238670.1 MATE family efflux transporter [Ponticoccus sp. SC6-49]MBM1242451.1 MATE family efflux transporter [Ponticoccus sp. SC2-64]MBM1247718.1 MATE family efflux
MTEAVPGRDLPGHRRVLAIALPIVLSNATVPILGAVDTGVVGQLGEAAPIGAVGIGAIILTAFYWLFGFLRMGTTGLTSQAHGAGDGAEVAALLSRALIVAGVAGLGLILLQGPLFGLGFLVSPASDEVEEMARAYMGIRIWSAPAAIAIYGITGWLIAQERTRAVLVIQVWMNGLNVLLDLWFVLGLGWGVEGVAIATFLAEWSGAALGLWFCRAAFAGPYWRDAARVFDAVRIRRMISVNTDILIRSVLLQAIFVSFLFWGAGIGDVTLAANQVLLQFLHITAYGLDGFAFAAEAIVGQAVGARALAVLRRGAWLASLWAFAICLGLALTFALAGGAIIDLMTTAPEVRLAAKDDLVWMVLAPVVGLAPWMLDGIFIGATRTRDMRNMMALSAAGYFAAAPLLVAWLGNDGLWVALLLSFALRGITLGLRYPSLEREVAAG